MKYGVSRYQILKYEFQEIEVDCKKNQLVCVFVSDPNVIRIKSHELISKDDCNSVVEFAVKDSFE